MNIGWILFGTFFSVIFIILIFIYIIKPSYFHLALHNITNRRKSAVLAIAGLLIGSTIISGSLILGDSMRYMVKAITLENLGELDILVTSNNYFDYEIYQELQNDPEMQELTDKIVAAITFYGSASVESSRKLISKIRIVGYDENYKVFGDFNEKEVSNSGSANLTPELIINDVAASELDIEVGNVLGLQFSKPEYSLDTIYFQDFNSTNKVKLDLVLSKIVYREGFAKLQNSGRTNFLATAYLPIDFIQKQLGVTGKINTIFISNKGNAEKGIEKDDQVEKRLEELLNEHLTGDDLGLELKRIGNQDYIRYSTGNIFFPSYQNEFLSGITDIEGIKGHSEVLTYFVNYIESESGEKVWYSTVSGFDPEAESQFEQFRDHNSKELIDGNISDDEIILNNLTAEALGVEPGDSITLNYMIIDRLFSPRNITAEFTVKYIVSMEGKAADRWLMPDFPGIDTELDLNPLDWGSVFYINQTQVLNLKGSFEHRYWTQYRGAPKAFITLEKAQNLWSFDYGDLTGFKIYYDSSNLSQSSDYTQVATQLQNSIDENIDYTDAGITINHVKRDSFNSASALDIFPQMFLTFGAIIIMAGSLFVINIMVTMIYNRRRELGILRALGSKRKTVISILTLEGMLYALPASLLGTLFGIGVAFGLAYGLNNIWNEIVEGFQIPFNFTIESLFYGFFGGFIIGIITIIISSWRMSSKKVNALLREDIESDDFERVAVSKKTGCHFKDKRFLLGLFFIILGLIFGFLLLNDTGLFSNDLVFTTILFVPVLFLFGAYFILLFLISFKTRRITIFKNRLSVLFGIMIFCFVIFYSFNAFKDPTVPGLTMFFLTGLLLVLGLFMIIIGIFMGLFEKSKELKLKAHQKSGNSGNIRTIFIRNISRNRFRSISTVLMFALVVFLIFALTTNIMLQFAGRDRAAEVAGGGFDLYGESTIPLNFDINDKNSRIRNGVDHEIFESLEIISMKSVGHEIGKCSNMNAVYPPRIYGVNEQFIGANDFSFLRTKFDSDDKDLVWNELMLADNGEIVSNNDRIPIIGDYETLVWLYYGDVGSVFKINDDYGNEYKLEVIAIINSPIFSGSFIMAEPYFDSLFPFTGELKSFLFKTTTDPEVAKDILEWELRESGMSISTTDELTEESLNYISAYMSMFQLYLYFGLIVGISALGVLSLKSVSERKYEIGVLKSLGLRNSKIFSGFILENTIICSLGILIGAAPGILIAVLSYPFWGLSELTFTFSVTVFLISVMLSLIFITILLTFYPAYKASSFSSAKAMMRIE